MHKHVLNVGEGVFDIPVVVDPVLGVLLAVTRSSKHDCVWNAHLRRLSLNHCVVENLRWRNLKSSVSHLQIAHVWIGKTPTLKHRQGSSRHRANVGILGRDNLRIVVVSKLSMTVSEMLAIHGHFHNILHVLPRERGFKVSKLWCATVKLL